jgi:hypothetical protein
MTIAFNSTENGAYGVPQKANQQQQFQFNGNVEKVNETI